MREGSAALAPSGGLASGKGIAPEATCGEGVGVTGEKSQRTDEPDIGTPGGRDAMLAEFSERAGALGVDVVGCVTSDAAGAAIRRFAAELDVSRLVIPEQAISETPDLVSAIRAAGVMCVVEPDPAVIQHEAFGLSLGRLAVAETGSVLLAEPSLGDRAIGMLVTTQVMVCRTADLVPTLDEAAPVLLAVARQPGGAYATLVTGPSRTADIERVLTVGVQGPARVIVVFVDDLT